MTVIKVAPKDEKLEFKRHLLNILLSFSYVLLMARVTGLLYFTIRGHQLETNKIRSLLYSIIYFTMYLGFFLMGFQERKFIMDGSFFTFVVKAIYVLSCGNVLLEVVHAYFVRFRMAKWLNRLVAFDVDMEKIGVIFDFKLMRKHLINLVIMEIILILLRLALHEAAFCNPWSVFLSSITYHTLKSIYKVTFVAIIGHVHLRFNKINDVMIKFNPDGMVGLWESIFPVTSDIRQDSPWMLDQLCKFHFKLCHLTRILNGIVSSYFFYSFAISLGTMMFYGYFLNYDFRRATEVDSEFDPMSRRTIITLVFLFVSLVHEFVDCLVITRACESLCNDANGTPKILHELRIRTKGRAWDYCIIANSLQFMHQKVIFSAYGYFNINLRVFISMIELIITYVVLFIHHDRTTLGPTSDVNGA